MSVSFARGLLILSERNRIHTSLYYSEQSRSPSTLMVAFGSLRKCRLFLASILISLLFTVPSALVRETVNLTHLPQTLSSLIVSGIVPSVRLAHAGSRVTVSPD